MRAAIVDRRPLPPGFHEWVLTGPVDLQSGNTLELQGTGVVAESPLIPTYGARYCFITWEIWTPQPDTRFYWQSSYYGADGQATRNSVGYTANGAAIALGAVEQWERTPPRQLMLGAGVHYIRLAPETNLTYGAPGMRVRNPQITFHH